MSFALLQWIIDGAMFILTARSAKNKGPLRAVVPFHASSAAKTECVPLK